MVPSGMRRCGRGRKRRGSAMEVAASGARLGDAARARSGPAAVVGEQRWPPGGVGAGIGARRRRLDLGLRAALGLDAARSGAQGYDRCDAACLELVCWFLHMVRRSLVMLVVEDDPELQVLGRARGEKRIVCLRLCRVLVFHDIMITMARCCGGGVIQRGQWPQSGGQGWRCAALWMQILIVFGRC